MNTPERKHICRLRNDAPCSNALGARPPIAGRLAWDGRKRAYYRGRRITDGAGPEHAKNASDLLRAQARALQSRGVPNSSILVARTRTRFGHVITAKPLDVSGGVDYLHTGQVRWVKFDC